MPLPVGFSVMPKTDTAKLLVERAMSQLRAAFAALATLRNEMQSLAASLPDPVAMGMFGVGPALGPRLMVENGDVRRLHSKIDLLFYSPNLRYFSVLGGSCQI